MFMKKKYKVVCFGDSLTNLYTPHLNDYLRRQYPNLNCSVINKGTSGETTEDALKRIDEILSLKPDAVVIGFGMNDGVRDCLPVESYCKNLVDIIESFEGTDTRILLLTIQPVAYEKHNDVVDTYNNTIRGLCTERRMRLVDINSLWKRKIFPISRGLVDSFHPNKRGITVYCEALSWYIPRPKTIFLWQYNGNPCECNYSCPYCQYPTLDQKGDYFFGTIEQWRDAFKNHFKGQELVFYFGHGEPTIGKKFYEVVDMIGQESKWEMRMITNLSQPLESLVRTDVAKTNRLNINASFHPYQVDIDGFIEKLLFLREHGIETPVVYVMYPPLLERFERDFERFSEHGFVVHVRRFRGLYKGRYYPEAYTDEERRFIAKYCDDATIRYMLNEEPSYGKLTYTGMDFFLVDNVGNIKYCDDYRGGSNELGNLFQNTIHLLQEPSRFPAEYSSDGTVDGVANLLELNYIQLSANHILDFARRGGVYKDDSGLHYGNLDKDFTDGRTRAEHDFPPRSLHDLYWIIMSGKLPHFITKYRFWRHQARNAEGRTLYMMTVRILKKDFPRLFKIIKTIHRCCIKSN